MKEQKNKKIEEIRHSISHLMSMAIVELYPKAGLGVGPFIDNGFYQDYDLGEEEISEEIFEKLEKRIRELIKKDIAFNQHAMSFDDALKIYKDDQYKTEMIKDLQKAGEKNVSFFESDGFENLCKGPHVKNTKEINPEAFKLMSIAGAYWKGNEKNKMLTRIYGVAFNNKNELDDYLKNLEEAKERDHRKLNKILNLYLVDPIVGAGLPMWKPKGAMLWRVMEDFWYREHIKAGYELVRTPHIGSRTLWETSGHWGFYSESMYPPIEVGQSLESAKKGEKVKIKEEYLLKPMNCPFHVVIYNSQLHSYRDLPKRWAESAAVYRYEQSGEVSGLTRVRGFTQDDAHIICRKDQVEEELKRVLDFIIFIFSSFGFYEYKTYLSLRDPANKEKYAGNDEGWEFTENILEKVAKEKKLDFIKEEGEAAFYGPKLDFKVKDFLGREWQTSTLQFDFNLPEKFNMTYINEQGKEEAPYILHRALFGSFERFIGVLIEHYKGAFPIWLAPVQVRLVSVADRHIDYVKKLEDKIKGIEGRVELDISSETIGNKIRKAAEEKIPYTIVIGDKEMDGGDLQIKVFGKKEQYSMSEEDFLKYLQEKNKSRDLEY